MLARLNLFLFLIICLLSAALGAGLVFVFLKFVSAGIPTQFGDVVATVILVPLGFICPPWLLFSIRREQRQFMKEFRRDGVRHDKQFLAPEWALLNADQTDGQGADATQDHYEVLGVGPEASGPEIEASYHRLMDELTANTGDDASSPDKAEAITTAYSVLSDPGSRVKYDLARLSPRGYASDKSSTEGESKRRGGRSHDDQGRSKTGMSGLAFSLIGVVLVVAGAVLTFTALAFIYGR